MSSLRLVVLLAILAVAVAAVWLSTPKKEDGASRLLFPELTIEYLNTVNQITIARHGSSPVSVHLAEDGVWRVAQHYDYLANTVSIRNLLLTLADAEIVEQKTSLPDYYAQLDVADLEAGEGSGKLLTLRTADEEFGLIVGKRSRQVSGGQYVRKPGEADSWLINKSFDLPTATGRWLDKEMIHLEPDSVSTVTLVPPDDKPFTVIRDDNNELTIENLEEGKVLYQKERLRGIMSVTDYLYFKDVIPRDKIELPEEHIKLNIKASGGAIVDIKAYETADGKAYFVADSNSAPHRKNFAGWAFEVPHSVYENIDKRLDDFLAEPSVEEPSVVPQSPVSDQVTEDTAQEGEAQPQ